MNRDISERTERLFISWEPSNSRSAALAREFSATCHNVHYLALKRPILSPIKYILQSLKTWQLLFRARPSLIFVQNPPTFAPLAVWLYCVVSKANFIIDSHTGVFLERKWSWLSFLHRFLVRKAVVSIVTNDFLGEIVGGWGGKYFVFSDVPIEVGRVIPIDRPRKFVTVINSFSYDEPLTDIIDAATRMPDVSFAITGDIKRCPAGILEQAPSNVRFTGFITREEFLQTLQSSDAAVVLTTEDHTMQRGAYESMALGVPIVTSDWPLLRETFFKGACYTDNSADSIEESISTILGDVEKYKAEVVDLRSERRQLWNQKLHEFIQAYLTDNDKC